ncbi:MAG TPA: ABC transporter ATP-binding protein [Candidatus Aminicenantes bacterium]|nr:ABC transporter ATP-binding protein [Candidatus Aminicenantes bacterium]HRY64194.1 ABC transporter ATP-binding protein [Candidatus Aminicenantes bacterium]HRZ71107.1 ABC transporter ATP-binding protein [Candidatus Aminicenantes bacterium]
MAANVIELKDLVKTYHVGETDVRALRGVSYTVKEGDFLAIMGPSGSGKSSLMNILGCLDRPTSGQYLLDSVEVSTLDKNHLARIRNQKIGFVFQSFNLLSRTTALENVELPLFYSSADSGDMTERALGALAAVGLKDRAQHKTNQLSGGEQQRVAIARALLNNPSLILADEPTGNLDSKTSSEVMNIFKSLNEDKGITMVMVTHEPDIAAWAGKRIYLKDGLIVREETS